RSILAEGEDRVRGSRSGKSTKTRAPSTPSLSPAGRGRGSRLRREKAVTLAKRGPPLIRVVNPGAAAPSRLLWCGNAVARTRGGNHGTGHAHRRPPPSRRALFRGFPAGPSVRASPHPHGDADGQHVVLQHDAQSAAAAHRPALLRAG